ncbi:MAG TPA: hypothetical protein VHC23_06475 [Jatrophihabitans sp.]|nr:hypothetical protein [Jatrophihabitans sp.]
MNVALRGLTVLVGGAALATALATPALATPSATTSRVETVHSCSQDVSAGHYTCFAERRSDLGFKSRKQVHASPQATPSGYGPSSLQSAYALPSASAGSGQRVYVVDAYDDPNAESDLAAYRSQYGLPACTTANGCFKKLNQSGATSPLPAGDTGWAGEISLDLDMVSAVCPNCDITLIEAKDASDNLFTAVKTATNLGAKFVSLSWGGPETGSEASYDSTYFKSSGVVYTASTGDDAYQYGVIYPATSVDAVAVGGTSLSTASNARGWSEKVWKTSSSEGTGSGCSSDEAKPSWQSIIASSVCSRRADSDVSAVADPATGVAVYQTYGGSGWAVYGGTSASAPIIASVYALAGTPSSTDKPASFPYAHTGNLNDVTSGNNGSCSPSLLCTAASGWDGPTGLGTPNGVAAFTAGSGGGGGGGGGGGTGCSGQKLTNPGFESGSTGWTQTSGVINTDGAHSRTGSGYAWLDGYGSTHTDTLSQSVTIPAGCTATLTYYLSVSTQETTTSTAYDKLTLSVNGTTKQTFSNLSKGSYAQRSVDLSAYAGQTVTIKWTGSEDSSLATSFLIDDTALSVS